MCDMCLKTLCLTVVWTPSVSLIMAWRQCLVWITLVAIVNLGDIACYRDRPVRRQGMLRLNQRSIEARSDYEIISTDSRIDDRGPRYRNASHQMRFGGPILQTRRGLNAEAMSSRRALSVQGIPEECRKTGVCETVPNYPEAAVESVIKQLGDDASKIFTIDELLAPTFTQRNGGAPEETELCTSREQVIYPQAAKSKEGDWYYILNRRERPLQGLRVEICSGDTSSCNTNVVTIPSFYESTCKQKHILRKMAALDDNNQLIEKSFPIPSCCSCVVTANSDF